MKRCYSIVFVIFSICSFQLFAQSERTNHWYFSIGNTLDFTNTSPSVGSFAQPIPILPDHGGLSAISNEDGDLLMYSDGTKLFNANEVTMPNGTGLLGSFDVTQTSILVPRPNSSSIHYLFTLSSLSNGNGLNYYEVDMTLDAGLGDISSTPFLLLDSTSEKLCATRHSNDIDYWVVTHRWESDEFHAYHVSETGVNSTPVISAIGLVHTFTAGSGERVGQMKISPDGTKIATANFASGVVQLYDFNAATGVVSNMLEVTPGIISQFPFGIEFSADSKKFYYGRRVSNGIDPVGIHQFDLDHINTDCLLNSEIEFANVSEFKLISDLQLGLDKKIYVSYYAAGLPISSLSTIHQPEQRCPDCDFVDVALVMNQSLNNGLTNFVSSYLSDGIRFEFGSNCLLDTTFFWPEDTFQLDSVLWTFDDPASGILNISTTIFTNHYFSIPDTYNVQLITYRPNRIDTFNRNTIIWDVTDNLLGNDTTICQGNTLTLNSSWYNSCQEWFDGTNGTTKLVIDSGWYWVDVDHQACHFRDSIYIEIVEGPPALDLGSDTIICIGDSITFTPNPQIAFYTWSNGSHQTSYTTSVAETVWLKMSNACGDTIDTVEVDLKIGVVIQLNLPEDTTICEGDSFSYDVTTGGGASYLWDNNSTQPTRLFNQAGSYWIQVSNECGFKSDSMNLETSIPLVSALEQNLLYCGNDDTLELQATSLLSDALWSTGELNATIQVANSGLFWYVDSNECGSISDSTFIVAFDTNFTFNLPKDSSLCAFGAPFIIGYEDTIFDFNYAWNTGLSNPFETVSGKGIYELTLSNKCVSISDVFELSIAEPITINKPTNHSLCEVNPIILTPSVFNFNSLVWNNEKVDFQFEATEPGIVKLEIFDTNNCLFTDTFLISENCNTDFSASNVFTPNGDGINDLWCAESRFERSFIVSVYNRWGTEVFQSTESVLCWDGYIQGELARAGTYFYIVELENELGETKIYKGSFSLINQ